MDRTEEGLEAENRFVGSVGRRRAVGCDVDIQSHAQEFIPLHIHPTRRQLVAIDIQPLEFRRERPGRRLCSDGWHERHA